MSEPEFEGLRKLMSKADAEEFEKARPIFVVLLERAGVPVEEAEELVAEAVVDWFDHGKNPGLAYFVDERCRQYAKQKNRPYTGLHESEELVG